MEPKAWTLAGVTIPPTVVLSLGMTCELEKQAGSEKGKRLTCSFPKGKTIYKKGTFLFTKTKSKQKHWK